MQASTSRLACALGLALFCASSAAKAEPDCAARVHFLRHTLSQESSRAETWTRAWGGTLMVATVGQMVVLPLVDEDERVDYYIGAGSSFVGFLSLAAAPLTVMNDGPEFEERVIAHEDFGGDLCALAKSGEHLLEQGAESEAVGTGVLAHTGNVLFNVGLGMLLGWGFGHWESGVINMVAGTAIGELMIWTQPRGLASALARYRAGDFYLSARKRRVGFSSFTDGKGASLGLSLSF